ncbi:hypothetical protein [Thiomicrorhabdus sp.]|uniref:hypothetical protein n=1 Tax=Thiomicrorhabdus sp. TaxID=2039724 RepID=UPI0029C6B087|nr:hypothetical protein [Thiomicrorhabdus sp.]
MKLKPLHFKMLIAAGITSSLLTGCGGGGGSSSSGGSNTPSTLTLSGQVIDPEVEGAVTQLCETSSPTNCLTLTDVTNAAGGFAFTLDSSTNWSDYSIVAKGGVDVQTGESFQGLRFIAPLSLYSATSGIKVTPITTLIAENMFDGDSLEQAKAKVVAQLNIEEDEIDDSPLENTKIMQRSLLLSKIAMNRSDGFTTMDDAASLQTLIDEITDADLKARLNILSQTLDKANSAQSSVNLFTIMQRLLESDLVETDINSEHYLDLSDATVMSNLTTLAVAMADFFANEGISQVIGEQVSRLLLEVITADNEAAENDKIDFTATNFSAPTLEANGIDYAAITKADYLNHTIALAEALDGSSDAKREYYYQSTASQIAQAEQVLQDVTDGSTLDAVYYDLAYGFIENDQPQLALDIASRKIFEPYSEALVIASAVNKQAQLGLTNETSKALVDKALELYKGFAETKGLNNLSATNLTELRRILNAYTALDSEEGVAAYNAYLNEILETFGMDATPYFNLIIGLTQAAENLIAEGNIELAEATLETATGYADITPPNDYVKRPDNPERWHYRLRVNSYASIADVYALIDTAEAKAKSLELFNKAHALRLDDSVDAPGVNNPNFIALTQNGESCDTYDTSKKADSDADGLVSTYLNANPTKEELETYIATICSTSYQANAWNIVATATAFDDVDAAIALIDEKIDETVFSSSLSANKIKFLTLNGVNMGTPYMALSLIQAGQNAAAIKALNRAEEILVAAIANGEESSDAKRAYNYVQKGYSNLGLLYRMAGDTAKSDEMYDMAEKITAQDASVHENALFPDPYYTSYAYAYLARSYGFAGLGDKALTAAQNALTELNKITTVSQKVSLLGLVDVALDPYKKYHLADPAFVAKLVEIEDAIYDFATGAEALDPDSEQEDLLKRLSVLDDIVLQYRDLTQIEKAETAINKMIEYANALALKADQITAYQAVVEAYAVINDTDAAYAFAKANIDTRVDFLESIEKLAYAIRTFDAFAGCEVATIDNDRDGLPDFYSKGASEEAIAQCGLTMDDDSDNDGIPDSEDLTPFYASETSN